MKPHGETLRWIGAIGIAAIAVMRCLSVFSPELEFATDPVYDPSPAGGLTPLGSLVLDALLVLSTAIALLGEARSGRGVSWLLVALAIVPAPGFWISWSVGVGYGESMFDDIWRESMWWSAIIGGVGVAHLARGAAMRRVFFAVLASLAVPLIARGLAQVYVEHEHTVSFYRDHRLEVLASRGIDPDSNAASIFERRLMQPEATGWFGLANIFASFMAVGLAAWLGATIGAFKAKLPSGWTGVLALAAIGSAAGLWLAGSRGAYAAAILGVALVIAPHLSVSVRTWLAHHGCWVLPAAVICAFLGIVVRGTILPEGFLGEKSVLFRWHYLLGASRMIADNFPGGVGPSMFQHEYLWFREPNAPEEVASAHSIFVDWLAMLGGLSMPWIAMCLLWMWRAGKSLASAEQDDGARSPTMDVVSACGALAVGGVAALWFEITSLDGPSIVYRVIGLAAGIATAAVAARAVERVDGAMLRWTLAAAAAALLAHSQIEMTLIQPGSVVAGMVLLGAAGAGRVKKQWFGDWFAVILIGSVVLPLTFLIVSAAKTAGEMRRIAAPLRAIGEARMNRTPGDGPLTAAELAAEADARMHAADRLLLLHDKVPFVAHGPALAAAYDQVMRGAALTADPDDRLARLRWALRLNSERSADTHQQIARLTHGPADWAEAVRWRRARAAHDVHGLNAQLALADTLWDAGEREEARTSYQRVLEIDANWYLDELKQLSDRDRARVRGRAAAPDPDS